MTYKFNYDKDFIKSINHLSVWSPTIIISFSPFSLKYSNKPVPLNELFTLACEIYIF